MLALPPGAGARTLVSAIESVVAGANRFSNSSNVGRTGVLPKVLPAERDTGLVRRPSQLRKDKWRCIREPSRLRFSKYSFVVTAIRVSRKTGLLTNDALMIALMQANGLTKLANNDTDRDRVPGLTRYAPG
jgi:predicted nucleic acid-binding protein